MNKLLPLFAAFAFATAAQLSPVAATEAGPGPRAAIHNPNVQRTLTLFRLHAARDAARRAVDAARFRSDSPGGAAPQSGEAAAGPAQDTAGQTPPTK